MVDILVNVFDVFWYPFVLLLITVAFLFINVIILMNTDSVIGNSIAIALFGSICFTINTFKDSSYEFIEQFIAYGVFFVINAIIALIFHKKNAY